MNDAPTPAKTSAFESQFSKGATATLEGISPGIGGDPEKMSKRLNPDGNFRGSSSQPLRKGNQRKFQDGPENHPEIPMSGMSNVTSSTPRGISTRGVGTSIGKQTTAKNPNGKL